MAATSSEESQQSRLSTNELFSYEDKSWSEREFDRDFGYYTERHPNHEYRIEITNESTITEYVFNSRSKLEKKIYTLEELKSIMKNTYKINIYNREDPLIRTYEDFDNGKLAGKGSEVMGNHKPYYPEDDGWIKDGICYEYLPIVSRCHIYKNGEMNGWNVEKYINTDEITERLYDEDSNCLGYRIKQNGIITKNTISDKDFEKYGDPPSLE